MNQLHERFKSLSSGTQTTIIIVVGVVFGLGGLLFVLVLAAVTGSVTGGEDGPVTAEVDGCGWTGSGYPSADVELKNSSSSPQEVFVNMAYIYDGEQIADGIGSITMSAEQSATITITASSVSKISDLSFEGLECEVTSVDAYDQ